MGLKICSIASGSTGNCIAVASDTTTILVDVGIPATRAAVGLAALGRSPEGATVLVTHSHSDHISNVPTFANQYGCKTYAHFRTMEALTGGKGVQTSLLQEFGESDFYVGDITVSPFPVSHDVPCVGYSFLWRGKKISLATDLGIIGNAVIGRMADSDVVLIESNHDEDLLRVNRKYGEWLKRRILSERGHLSNRACAEAAVKLAAGGVRQLLLGHLSQENNYPELAFSAVRAALDGAGYDAETVKLEVARADRLSGLFEIV